MPVQPFSRFFPSHNLITFNAIGIHDITDLEMLSERIVKVDFE
jgi:hypothetical protein